MNALDTNLLADQVMLMMETLPEESEVPEYCAGYVSICKILLIDSLDHINGKGDFDVDFPLLYHSFSIIRDLLPMFLSAEFYTFADEMATFEVFLEDYFFSIV